MARTVGGNGDSAGLSEMEHGFVIVIYGYF